MVGLLVELAAGAVILVAYVESCILVRTEPRP
jgi:hypothetical protein